MALEAVVLSKLLLDPFSCYNSSSNSSNVGSWSMFSHYYDLLSSSTTAAAAGSSSSSSYQFIDPLDCSFNKYPVISTLNVHQPTNKSTHPAVPSSITVGNSSSSNNYYGALPLLSPSIPVSSINPDVTSSHEQWNHHHHESYHQQQLYGPSSISHNYSSSDDHHQHIQHGGCGTTTMASNLDGLSEEIRAAAAEVDLVVVAPTTIVVNSTVGKRKRRRRSTTKNKEEVENQRMTHIAVERNRRKQMNEYLSVIRSLMPPSYVHRGDQASIVGGAINYVKELEQLLQSLESQKRKPKSSSSSSPQQSDNHDTSDQPIHHSSSPNLHHNTNNNDTVKTSSPFTNFFSFPQYSNHNRKSNLGSTTTTSSSPSTTFSSDHEYTNSYKDHQAAAGEIEVTMAENHANVKILSKRQPRQLVKLVAGFQSLRLSVLHLNVTSTADHFVLYSFSLKVEEGCLLSSVDEIASAANHILGRIQREEVESF